MITRRQFYSAFRNIRTTNELRNRFADVNQRAIDDAVMDLADRLGIEPEDIYLEIMVDINRSIRRRHLPSAWDDIPRDRQRIERTGDRGEPRNSWKVRHRGAKAWDKYHNPGRFRDLPRREKYHQMLEEMSEEQLNILDGIFEDGWDDWE